MKNTIQLFIDNEKKVKGYPITSPDRVIDDTGVSIKKRLQNNVKFDIVGDGEEVPELDGKYDDTEIKKQINDISEQLDNIIQQRGYVTYEDFGAKGDGVTDDGEAIKQAHIKANSVNKIVFCPIPKKFYIKNIENIPVETSVNWNGSTIVIDDNINLTNPIFIVNSTQETKILDEGTCSSIINLDKNSVEIPLLKGYGQSFIEIINDDKKIFIREGANADSGNSLCDMSIIDNDGMLKEKLNWDFDKVTRIAIFPLPSDYITLENAIFKTISDTMDSHVYINRGITIKRSKTIIKNITHRIEQDKDNVGRCYNGFIHLSHCCDIQILDTTLTPRFFKHNNSVPSGTYDLGASYCLNLHVNNLQAFSNNASKWGVWGANFIKNLTVINSKINRVDAHKGVFNITIKDTVIGNKGITICGGGTLILNNIETHSSDLVTFRGDFGATWLGDIFIENIRHYSKTSHTNILNGGYNVDHNYGYKCTLGENIISIKNYTVYPSREIDDVGILNTQLTHIDSKNVVSPYHIAKYIVVENLYVDNPLIGYVVLKNFDGNLLKAQNEGRMIKGEGAYNQYPMSITPNVFININNMQSSVKNVNYDSSSLIRFKNGFGKIATDTYGDNSLDILIKFTINNCDKISASVFGLPCILNINNSNICMCVNRNGGSRSKTIISDCEIVPVTKTVQLCVRCNPYESFINNTVFYNPNNLITDVTSLKGIYEIFNIYGDKTYKNLADIDNCRFDIGFNLSNFSNILTIAPNFPNGKSNTYEFPKIGTSALRRELSSYGYLQGLITNFYDTDLNKMLYRYNNTWKDSNGNNVN